MVAKIYCSMQVNWTKHLQTAIDNEKTTMWMVKAILFHCRGTFASSGKHPGSILVFQLSEHNIVKKKHYFPLWFGTIWMWKICCFSGFFGCRGIEGVGPADQSYTKSLALRWGPKHVMHLFLLPHYRPFIFHCSFHYTDLIYAAVPVI